MSPRAGAWRMLLLGILSGLALPGRTGPAPAPPLPELLLPLDCDSLPLCFRAGMALDAAQDLEVRRILADALRQREALRADTFRRLRATLDSRQAGLLEERRAALLSGQARHLATRAGCLKLQEATAPVPATPDRAGGNAP